METPVPNAEPRLPAPLAKVKEWLRAHHVTLLTIADTPHSVALGSAIGFFFGFTPLYPLKTLLSIGAAWVARGNKLAAAIFANVHDILFVVMPAVYFTEYRVGCWVMGLTAGRRAHLRHQWMHDIFKRHVFSRVIWPTFWPMFVGSLFFAIPSALIIYIIVRMLLSRGRPEPVPG